MACKANAAKEYFTATMTNGVKDMLLNERTVGNIVARKEIRFVTEKQSWIM
jgi:hypothetical protein